MPTIFLRGCILLALCLVAMPVRSADERPSIKETVDGLIDRLSRQLRPYELRYLSDREVERSLTPSERMTFATEHISFRVNVPVTVYVLRTPAPKRDPYWLRGSFTRTDLEWKLDKTDLTTWKREFAPGRIGLGVNSFIGGGSHYGVLLTPKFPGDAVIVTDLYPTNLNAVDLKIGAKFYSDRDNVISNVPPQFAEATLIQTSFDQRDAARVRDLFRWTDFPATDRPDQIVLTWSGDPRTTQTIQWRTSERVSTAFVRYAKKSDIEARSAAPFNILGTSERLYTRFVVNNPVVRRHTVTLTNLEPGVTYRYSVGDGTARNWSSPAEFTTAPETNAPFSFIYMGDAQNGLYRWGALLRRAHLNHPDAAFYLIAGDLVNRGHERDDWDLFFYNARGVFDRRAFIPVIGNHDCIGGDANLYLSFFDLPDNGPRTIEKGRAYSLNYGDSLFVVLDSNLSAEKQTEWLEQQLAGSTAAWKFVSFHHPAFSSAPNRDNEKIREHWVPAFERYGVDFVLQGHDHAYLRTQPMKGGSIAGPDTRAPIYLVSVSGTKMYKQEQLLHAAMAFTNVPTYQTFEIVGSQLTYRAFDHYGKIRDELIINKAGRR